MNSTDFRKKFIEYFEKNNHKIVAPASLVPENDPSVLFTTAGMQQFKRYYTNSDEAPAQNVVSVQPCFRTSDIDEVSDDTHLTFFEMLGNFSFGGYGKEKAIKWGYEFLTKEIGIRSEKIWCSTFGGDDINPRDNESIKILSEMGLKYKEHGRTDNFWGPTGSEGPCGPTVEFYIDDIEIWNLVFNEYFKNSDGSYRKLETLGIDTGMGLERLLVVLNNENIYETDLFAPIISKIEEISGKKYEDSQKEFRIIADHVKAATFAINNGILPSNKEQGYIVRRLIRRAIIKAKNIGIQKEFAKEITEVIFGIYRDIYNFKKEIIISELEKEETNFRKTLKDGLKILKSKDELTGEDLFNLYQSYGIPVEISTSENVKVSPNALDSYKNLYKAHQEKSKTAAAGMFRGGLISNGEMETKYHTTTHLLLASLRQVLGDEVYQRGSNINSERLRFDFSYPNKLTDEQIKEIENIVNENIKKDLEVSMQEMTLDDAKKSDAIGIFENKYGDKVKVYTISDPSTLRQNSGQASSGQVISREICGGPHVKRTSELGHFKIIKEESSSSGIRRIKAVLE